MSTHSGVVGRLSEHDPKHDVNLKCPTVFNYPTFSETCKVAALDVMNKLRMLEKYGN